MTGAVISPLWLVAAAAPPLAVVVAAVLRFVRDRGEPAAEVRRAAARVVATAAGAGNLAFTIVGPLLLFGALAAVFEDLNFSGQPQPQPHAQLAAALWAAFAALYVALPLTWAAAEIVLAASPRLAAEERALRRAGGTGAAFRYAAANVGVALATPVLLLVAVTAVPLVAAGEVAP